MAASASPANLVPQAPRHSLQPGADPASPLSTAERLELATRVRAAALEGASELARSTVGLYEAILTAEAHGLYVEMGYGTVREWIDAEITPRFAAARSTISRMLGAARMHHQLTERFGDVRAPWTSLSCLAVEENRQRRGAGRLSGTEFDQACSRAAAGELGRDELEQMLRPRKARSRGRVPGKAARRALVDVAAELAVLEELAGARRRTPDPLAARLARLAADAEAAAETAATSGMECVAMEDVVRVEQAVARLRARIEGARAA